MTRREAVTKGKIDACFLGKPCGGKEAGFQLCDSGAAHPDRRGRQHHLTQRLQPSRIDIKTGQLPTKVAVKTFEDIQLGLYLWMLNQTKQVSAHYFTKNNTLKTMLDSSDNDFLELFLEFKGRIKTIILNIQSGMFLPEHALVKASARANACRTCNYYAICHYPDRHYR